MGFIEIPHGLSGAAMEESGHARMRAGRGLTVGGRRVRGYARLIQRALYARWRAHPEEFPARSGGGGRRRAARAAPGRLTAIAAGLALGISIMPMNSSNPGHLAADISNVPGSFLSMRSKYRDAVYPAPEA
jgi:hypothetical protein